MSVRFSVIIPALNEARSIEHSVRETARVFLEIGQPFEIIVVDDGSTDATSSMVKKLQTEYAELKLISHDKNLGKGAAVKTGIIKAAGEWALFLDVDLAVHPSIFRAWIPELETSDIIIGSRRVNGAQIVEHQPWYRERLGQWFNYVVRSAVGLPYQDTQCGFKVFRLSACRPIFDRLESRGWAFDVELLARAHQAGLRVKELPVKWRNGPISRVRLGQAPAILLELLNIKRKIR